MAAVGKREGHVITSSFPTRWVREKKNIRLISALTGFPYFPAPCNQVFDEVKLNIAKEKTRQLAESLSPFARKSACKGNLCIDSEKNSFEVTIILVFLFVWRKMGVLEYLCNPKNFFKVELWTAK